MKKTNIYIFGLILLIYIIIFRIVLMEYFLSYINFFNIIFFAILSLWCYYAFGFQKRDNLKDYSAIQMTIIWFIVYYILIYLMGLFFGFESNVYSLKIFNIIKNISVTICYYAFRELFRYMLIRSSKRDKKKLFIVTTVFITILDIIMEINIGDFSNAFSIFEFVSISVIPNIAINLLLSYLACNFSYKTLFIFLMLMVLPDYFMPIFPKLGSYFGGILELIFIFLCYYEYSFMLEKWENKERYNKKYNKKIELFLIIIPMLIVVGLLSGLFKYHLFAIASNSMVSSFARGDAVLIEKISDEELDNLVIDDIIAFYYNDRMIVHRIVNIDKIGNKYLFKTKGDNNLSVDSWTVNNDMVYGKVIYSIKYIGIPSIHVSELIG